MQTEHAPREAPSPQQKRSSRLASRNCVHPAGSGFTTADRCATCNAQDQAQQAHGWGAPPHSSVRITRSSSITSPAVGRVTASVAQHRSIRRRICSGTALGAVLWGKGGRACSCCTRRMIVRRCSSTRHQSQGQQHAAHTHIQPGEMGPQQCQRAEVRQRRGPTAHHSALHQRTDSP